MFGFVVKLKAIKFIEELFCSLFSYINLKPLKPQASKTSY